MYLSSSFLFGLLLACCGVYLLFSAEVFSGVLLVVLAALFMPPVRLFFYKKTGIKLNTLQRIGLVFLVLLVAFVASAVRGK